MNHALQIAQHAVSILARWVGVEVPHEFHNPQESDAIKRAKKILSWPENNEPKPLRLLFDRVRLSQGQNKEHHWPARAIANSYPNIPYPKTELPDRSELYALKEEIKQTLTELNKSKEDWQNLSLLTLILEKYGSYLSFGDDTIALIDMARSTGAVAAALDQNPQAKNLSLVAGSLSGIQEFIYTIASAGALKSLRARSFYLELVTEEVIQQILEQLDLPRTNVIYSGGSNLYILAPAIPETKQKIKAVGKQLNDWLLDEFQGKLFLAIDCLEFTAEDVANANFSLHWAEVGHRRNRQKSQKFKLQLDEFMEPKPADEPCRVCHQDNTEDLQQLNPDESESVLACPICRKMFELGGQLLRVDAVVRSRHENLAAEKSTIHFKFPKTDELPATDVYYHLCTEWKPTVDEFDTVFLVNDWTIEHYKFRHFRNSVPLLLSNYGQRSQEESGFMRAGELAEASKGIKRVGYLQMDVDRLGGIIHRGLGESHTLPRLAGLSRQLSYFFKVYLNSLAERRQDNIPIEVKLSNQLQNLTKEHRQDLVFIYAGGDDLFISGAWDQLVVFGFDVYQCFRAYTGYHPDITLSGGVSIASVKYPLYQAAREAQDAEKKAKTNERDSLGLFGAVFKWSEWLGTANLPSLSSDDRDYLQEEETMPDLLLGVLPFVVKLNEQLELDASRSFVRNLLATAQLQDRMIAERQRQIDEIHRNQPRKSQEDPTVKTLKRQTQEIRYYLHLPKIAYTIDRLPKKVREHTDFAKVRTSLRSPYNACYFKAIATWIELLNRASSSDNVGKEKRASDDNVRREKEAIAERFRALVLEWDRDVAGMSFVAKKISHPAYQQIIEMGNAVVPLLLKELQERPNHWFAALTAITGADPIQPEQYGKTKQMAAAWLQWGREQGYTW